MWSDKKSLKYEHEQSIATTADNTDNSEPDATFDCFECLSERKHEELEFK